MILAACTWVLPLLPLSDPDLVLSPYTDHPCLLHIRLYFLNIFDVFFHIKCFKCSTLYYLRAGQMKTVSLGYDVVHVTQNECIFKCFKTM